MIAGPWWARSAGVTPIHNFWWTDTKGETLKAEPALLKDGLLFSYNRTVLNTIFDPDRAADIADKNAAIAA